MNRHLETGHLEALRLRSMTGMLHSAQISHHGRFSFWQGYTKALADALADEGRSMAAKDALSGYEPPTHLKAAWAALPVRLEALAIADVQQLLTAQGVEVAAQRVADFNVQRGKQLEDAEVATVKLDDEHATAVVDGDDGTCLHGGPPEKECDPAIVDRSEVAR